MGSALSVSKGCLEEGTREELLDSSKESPSLGSRWGKEGLLPYLGEGSPEVGAGNLDSDAANNKWKSSENML